MNEEIKKTLDEMRAAFDTKMQSLEEQQKSLEAREFEVAQREARAVAPVVADATPADDFRNIAKAMSEKRAITVGGTGRVSVARQIVKVCQEKTDLLKKVKFFYGPNAATKIPVLSARPAAPSKRAENATSITADSTATVTAAEIDPYVWSSVLPVSIEHILMSGSNFVEELPDIFAESFALAMQQAMLTGSGSGNMQGLFTNVPSGNQTATGTTATLPTIAELHTFAVKLRGKTMKSPCIIMHPDTYLNITNTTPTGYDPRLNELLASQPTIGGVPVYLSAQCPSGSTTGTIAVVGCDLEEYAIGAVESMTVRPVETPDSTSIFFKAYWAFSGTPVCVNNLFALKVK